MKMPEIMQQKTWVVQGPKTDNCKLGIWEMLLNLKIRADRFTNLQEQENAWRDSFIFFSFTDGHF